MVGCASVVHSFRLPRAFPMSVEAKVFEIPYWSCGRKDCSLRHITEAVAQKCALKKVVKSHREIAREGWLKAARWVELHRSGVSYVQIARMDGTSASWVSLKARQYQYRQRRAELASGAARSR